MHWKMKNLAFKLLEAAPGRRHLHAAGQTLVTRRRRMSIKKSVKTYALHVEAMEALSGAEDKVVMEFGSGRNLIASLLVSAAGARAVYAFDIHRLATTELVNDAIGQARSLGLPWRGAEAWPFVDNLEADLEAKYRIFYRAPGDASLTGLPDASVDWVCSTATLEHIPPPAIEAIMLEARRILRPSGRASMIIDYHDHYWSTDKSITPYNFYQYSAGEWARYNPPMHYVNRLRHSDFQALFDSLGFEVCDTRTIVPPDSDAMLDSLEIAPEFQRYEREDLAVISGIFLLAPRSR